MTPAIPVLSTTEHQAQAVFRVLLDCMARPGRGSPLPSALADGSDDDDLLAVLESLVDHETSYWVCPGLADRIEPTLVHRTRARRASLPEAEFVIADRAGLSSAIAGANIGTIECPDEGATVIAPCISLADGPVVLAISGPGVADTANLRVAGISAHDFEALVERNADFPLGLDLILVSWDGTVACLPRSSRICVSVRRR